MPCRDYNSDHYDPRGSYEFREIKQRADMLARIACKAMTVLEEIGKEDFLLLKDEEVRSWWVAHKEADRKERERELEVQRKQELKQRALDKLSDEEKEALGIKRKR